MYKPYSYITNIASGNTTTMAPVEVLVNGRSNLSNQSVENIFLFTYEKIIPILRPISEDEKENTMNHSTNNTNAKKRPLMEAIGVSSAITHGYDETTTATTLGDRKILLSDVIVDTNTEQDHDSIEDDESPVARKRKKVCSRYTTI